MTTLVVTAIGADRSGIVNALADVTAAHGGNWERSQLTELAGAFAGIVLVEVPQARVASFAAAVAALPGMTATVHEADAAAPARPLGRLTVGLLGNDRPGIVKELSGVFAAHGVSMEEFSTVTYDAPMAGGRLFEASLAVEVGPQTNSDALRSDLERLASELMVDVTVESGSAHPA
ncbi:MAG: ACT domain-containing protein [Propioniciclava sp.]|uniref:glycine cleavage system protein R n=1 Tax=Propioniciclava sp. TaxID=2038686 RepID=UPI0039E68FB9